MIKLSVQLIELMPFVALWIYCLGTSKAWLHSKRAVCGEGHGHAGRACGPLELEATLAVRLRIITVCVYLVLGEEAKSRTPETAGITSCPCGFPSFAAGPWPFLSSRSNAYNPAGKWPWSKGFEVIFLVSADRSGNASWRCGFEGSHLKCMAPAILWMHRVASSPLQHSR